MIDLSLIIFLFILGFYLWYTFITIFHLVRFGVGKRPKILALIFFIGSFVLFGISVYSYFQIEWQGLFQKIFRIR